MCAVIGAVLHKPTSSELVLLENVFLESSIRGLHATGVSYIKNGKLNTLIEPFSAEKFFHRYHLQSMLDENNDLYIIGHCRYSTSDLEYNQPISTDKISIVHNGVITQELPENWNTLYGYSTKTKNDSELLLKSVESGNIPLEEWESSSIAAVELHNNKKMFFYRNGKRPLYITKLNNGIIVTSTADIMRRASNDMFIAEEAKKDCVYQYDTELNENQIVIDTVDLQHVR